MKDSVVIGVTGHRPNRLGLSDLQLHEAVSLVLVDIALDARRIRPGVKLIALSALAEGSDRVFAAAALQAGYSLQAVLPMAQEDYLQTFSNQATHGDFAHLLSSASAVQTLDGSIKQASDAFKALGDELVRRSDLIIGIWDGGGSAGPGGTAAVMQSALAHHGVVGWIDATARRPVAWVKALCPEPSVHENFSLAQWFR